MTILRILQVPADVDTLRKVSSPIGQMNKELQRLAGDMLDTMRKHHGLGLSAIQVGVPVRMLVLNPMCGCPYSVMINPVVLEYNAQTVIEREGCLSIEMGKPEFMVRRHKTVRMWCYNRHGDELHLDVVGRAARVIQHEIDHLDGKLISDYAQVVSRAG